MEITKFEGESEEAFIWRLGTAKDNGQLDLSWDEIADIINEEYRSDDINYTSSTYRKPYQQAKRFYDAGVFTTQTDKEVLDALKVEQRQLQKERIKIQTEKLEYNKWLREEARAELLAEHIAEAIRELPPLEIPDEIFFDCGDKERSAILAFGDAHYGKELKIVGLHGETINEYTPEIFEQRMNNLLLQVLDICAKEGINTLNVYDLGDECDGMLRVSQLMKLRYGVIESAVRYGRYITEWLNELTKFVHVNYHMVYDSNHCQLRMLGQPKDSFKDENISYIISEKILDRMEGNPNFTFIKNPTGYIYDEQAGYNILGYHGEGKSMGQAIKDISSTYKTQIDFLVGGHKHHKATEVVGVESETISVPSIIGIDDYAMSLHKTSEPGATLFFLEKGKGCTIEYNIKL